MAYDLDSLEARISSCSICRDNPQVAPLPHNPRPVIQLSRNAKICIAGQAPGMRVHQTGIPFNDPSGDRLRSWMGIERDVFYDKNRICIVPMGFCFPGYDKNGGDLPPRKECRDVWHDEVYTALPQLELILVIGQYAQRYHLGSKRKKSVTDTVSSARDYWNSSLMPRCLPLPHPSWRNSAWLKKNSWYETDVLPLLRSEIVRILG